MYDYETLWSFKTARFEVILDCTVDDDFDRDDFDAATLAGMEAGRYTAFAFRVRVLRDEQVLAVEHLGGSVYDNPHEFAEHHRDPNPAHRNTLERRERGLPVYGCYFPDMVKTCLDEARMVLLTETLCSDA